MKLTYFQLETHLTKSLCSIYIVSGDELLLKQDAIRLLRKTAQKAGFTDRIRLSSETNFDWEELYPVLYSLPLLAEKRLIEMDFRDTTPNKVGASILAEYCNNPLPENLLLIDVGKADTKIMKSAWFQAIEKKGAAITLWPITRDKLPRFILDRAKKYKLSLQPDAANLLADYCEGNLIAAAQAIEKIYLLNLEKIIDADTIQNILIDESRFTVFDFIENLIAGNRVKTLHSLEGLKEEGTEPAIVLWAITRELRVLAEMSQKLTQGNAYDALFQKYRIFANRQMGIRKFLTRYTAKDCWQFLMHAVEIDKTIKGVIPGQTWDLLQSFCLKLI